MTCQCLSYIITSITPYFIGGFPNKLKLADITPSHKKDSRPDKTNYRPISILPVKIHERLLYNQMDNYFIQFLSKYQFGFRKGFSAQHCLIVMVERWKSESIKKA